jgi:glycosyltransferase involved in cell wall biosynthesis
MPVYNEGIHIAKTIRSYHKVVTSEIPCEIVICEDGSTDDTKEVLTQLKNELPITLHFGKEKKGYEKAAKYALSVAETPLVFMVDSDGQYVAEDFLEGIKYVPNYDIVIGRRVRSKESFHRQLLRKGFNFILRPVFNIPIHDVDCGYKIMKKEVIDKVLDKVDGTLPYSINAEFILRAHHHGFTIKEFEISHLAREFGETSVFPVRKLPKVVIGQLIGIIKLKIAFKKSNLE